MAQVKGESPIDDGVVGSSNATGKSGVFGYNPTAGGNGVAGISEQGNGLYGNSKSLNGVYGHSNEGSGIHGQSVNQIGVYGLSDRGDGVLGVTKSVEKSGLFGKNEATTKAKAPGGSGVFGLTVAPDAVGVFGANNNTTSGRGVHGNGAEAGVGGYSENGTGIIAFSKNGNGLLSTTDAAAKNALFASNNNTGMTPQGGAPAGNGVFGLTTVQGGNGVFGANNSSKGRGIQGNGPDAGVGGYSEKGTGVIATSMEGDGIISTTDASSKNALFASNNSTGVATNGMPGGNGVFGLTTVQGAAGIFGANNSSKGRGVQGNGPDVGVAGYSKEGIGILGQGKIAARFEGNVDVTGNLTAEGDIFLKNADLAEDFDVIDEGVAPGCVMVLTPDGSLTRSSTAYDTKVAGVVSGAGAYKPAIILDKQKKHDGVRLPIAMMGKVYCRVDASFGAVQAGDLLTTSPTLGHAMKALDPLKFCGAVIGKALRPLQDGQGLIPVLIALQ